MGSDPGDIRFAFTSPMVFGAGDQIKFDIVVDADNPLDGIPAPWAPGTPGQIIIDMNAVNTALQRSNGTINTYKEYASVLRHVLTGTGMSATTYWKYDPPDQRTIRVDVPDVVGIVYRGLPGTDGSSMEIKNVTSTGVSITTELGDTGTRFGRRSSEMNLYFNEFRVREGVVITLDFVDHRNNVTPLTFDKQYVNMVLGVEDGSVSTSEDMAILLNALISRSDIIIQDTGPGTVNLKTDVMVDRLSGGKSSIGFYNIRVNIEPIPTRDFLDIDITTQPDELSAHTAYIETVQQRAIEGAAILGALRSRIDMQSEFASKMLGNIDRGIGRLVDADMNEASTRLKAIQTQQQLAIQALSIANSEAQGLMSLFR
ncbi:flagellin [Shinella zoogloeoides]